MSLDYRIAWAVAGVSQCRQINCNIVQSVSKMPRHISIVSSSQLEGRECLLLFGTEYFVFQFAIKKVKDQNIQNYNIARCSVWV